MANYGLGNSSAVENVFNDPYSDVSSFNSVEKRQLEVQAQGSNSLASYTNVSQIPIGQVRSYVFDCDQIIKKLIYFLTIKQNINYQSKQLLIIIFISQSFYISLLYLLSNKNYFLSRNHPNLNSSH